MHDPLHDLLSTDVRLLALGVGLHVLGQAARGRAWLAILRLTFAEGPELPAGRVVSCWLAGTGAGGLLSARIGDAVKMFLLRRRLPDASYPRMAGTLMTEAVFSSDARAPFDPVGHR